MSANYSTMRLIEIDAAHRVPEHGSGCRNLHGHRYKVEAYVTGSLAQSGAQGGMTMDFKFIKEGLLKFIHGPCDHGMILRYDDELLKLLAPDLFLDADTFFKGSVSALGDCLIDQSNWNRGLSLCLLRVTPTAENLAAHWYHRLWQYVKDQSEHRAVLSKLRVWETPNCWAEYPSN